eukprot:1187490-Prorocentrum_minimum.AAC.2
MESSPVPVTCDFPLFRRRFLAAAGWLEDSVARDARRLSIGNRSVSSPLTPIFVSVAPDGDLPSNQGEKRAESSSSSKGRAGHNSMRVFSQPIALNLSNITRDDVPPSELQLRREKFAYFEKRCSPVCALMDVDYRSTDTF